MAEEKQLSFGQIIGEPPQLAALADEPVSRDDAAKQSVTQTLAAQMGPVYHLLRHQDTQTPLTVAVYGDWGTGKTTAMRWLEHALHQWTDAIDEKGDGVGTIRSVWFSPWKYDSKEEVWRGLIAEVIVRSLSIDGVPTAEQIRTTASLFGRFLGRGFLHALAAIKVKGSVGPGIEAEVDLASVREILEDLERLREPEAAYLNEFEKTLKQWVRSFIGDGKRPNKKRLVVFIDDLDRCMPGVALQVLEALKLYLDIPGIVFVVGIDHEIMTEVVVTHHEQFGVKREKASQYLSKMFQIEVRLDPDEATTDAFVEQQMEASGVWATGGDAGLSAEEASVFRKTFSGMANRNPREVKRLVNGAAMAGTGSRIAPREGGPTFAEAAQRYLLHWRLQRLDMRNQAEAKSAKLLGNPTGERWFEALSRLLRGDETGEYDDHDAMTTGRDRPVAAKEEGKPQGRETIESFLEGHEGRPHAHAAFADRIVQQLLLIPFRPLVSAEPAVEGDVSASHFSDLIREAVAAELGIDASKVSSEQIRSATKLDLSGSDITDVSALSGLTALQELYLSDTGVSDVSALSGLTALQTLSLGDTGVSDVSALSGLTALQTLSLGGTGVSDVSALSGLTAL
ncbi:MAG: P-loop NTPase fold protein, partial [Planctomycetota bacterium]